MNISKCKFVQHNQVSIVSIEHIIITMLLSLLFQDWFCYRFRKIYKILQIKVSRYFIEYVYFQMKLSNIDQKFLEVDDPTYQYYSHITVMLNHIYKQQEKFHP